MFFQRLASGAAIALLAAVLFAAVAFLRWSDHTRLLTIATSASVFLAFLTPFIIIAIRHQVRRERLKHIDLFAENFAFGPKLSSGQDAGAADLEQAGNVSFEFVRAKYLADLDKDKDFRRRTIKDIPLFPMMLHADWMLLFCAVPYMALAGFGMFILFAPPQAFLSPDGALVEWFPPSLLAVGGSANLAPQMLEMMHLNVLTVAGMAFAGAYFYTLRLFLRAVTVFDLSPVTFLRAFGHMVLSVTLAVVLFRFAPDWGQVKEFFFSLDGTVPSTTTPTAPSTAGPPGLASIWLVMAFALGFLPESAIEHLMRFAKLTYKRRYSEVEPHSPVVPLTVLDGIDIYTAFRLEEANIFDVQNLATYNPIMLHIEGPYGIYQTIDWVAQAQLCNVVGADRFLLLKTFNIRTIFDLQQAVLGQNAAPQIIAEVGRLLLIDTRRDARMRSQLLLPPSAADRPAIPTLLEPVTVQRLTEVILDDLHVHRLRQLWIKIIDRLDYNGMNEAGMSAWARSFNLAGGKVADGV